MCSRNGATRHAQRTKVCRYNWHSSGPVPCMGWPVPILKYEHTFRIKYTEAILSDSTIGNCYGLKLPKRYCSLKNKFIASFIIIFGTFSFRTAAAASTSLVLEQVGEVMAGVCGWVRVGFRHGEGQMCAMVTECTVRGRQMSCRRRYSQQQQRPSLLTTAPDHDPPDHDPSDHDLLDHDPPDHDQ